MMFASVSLFVFEQSLKFLEGKNEFWITLLGPERVFMVLRPKLESKL